jgi:DNA-binding XRE family transcriptional regulator
MSKIGSNIRKIRSVKGLSQTGFADIFNLKRANIGAYEEGRAEPKIDTVIEIANYFSIPLNDIFTKELTVNQLTHFRILDPAIEKTKTKKKSPPLKFISAEQLFRPLQFKALLSDENKFNETLYPLVVKGADRLIEVTGLLIEGVNNSSTEALICKQTKLPSNLSIVLLIDESGLAIGEYTLTKEGANIRLLESGETKTYKNVVALFEIMQIIRKPGTPSNLTKTNELLTLIEKRLSLLEKKT